jgi:hypothetical protein
MIGEPHTPAALLSEEKNFWYALSQAGRFWRKEKALALATNKTLDLPPHRLVTRLTELSQLSVIS